MNDLLNPYQLNEAICALLKEASRRVTLLVPQRMLPLLDLNSFADSAEERPTIHVVLIITHPLVDQVDSMQILAAISRMPHLCIFTSKGDYQAIIASEHSSIIVPGVAHPIHRTNSFASSLGSAHYPPLEEAITHGDLVFCKSPIYAKSFLGIRKKYIGSKVKRRSDKRIF